MNVRITSRNVGSSIPLLLAFFSAIHPLAAATPGVAPPESKPHGIAYAQWGVAWWQWMFSLPATVPLNPVLAKSAVDCGYGQSGHVWFLAGTLDPGVTQRSCTIPTGTALFVPVFNSWADNIDVVPPMTVEQLQHTAAWYADASELHASIDGGPVKDLFAYRAAYAPFGYTVPALDNMLQYQYGVVVPGADWPTPWNVVGQRTYSSLWRIQR